jgi:hypothetical protein
MAQQDSPADQATTSRLDRQCAQAMARIVNSINRSAGQHLRAMRAAWGLSKGGAA